MSLGYSIIIMFIIYSKMFKQNQQIIMHGLVQTLTPEMVHFPNQGVIVYTNEEYSYEIVC